MEHDRPLAGTTRPMCAGEVANRRYRILVVDDEPDLRRLNVEVLTQAGYETDSAEDGAAAWDVLNIRQYDLLITDNKMPRVTGLELIQQVRQARMQLPIIMATGTVPDEELRRQPWLTPDAVLQKPYTVQTLAAKVGELLPVRKTRKRTAAIQRNWQSLPTSFAS